MHIYPSQALKEFYNNNPTIEKKLIETLLTEMQDAELLFSENNHDFFLLHNRILNMLPSIPHPNSLFLLRPLPAYFWKDVNVLKDQQKFEKAGKLLQKKLGDLYHSFFSAKFGPDKMPMKEEGNKLFAGILTTRLPIVTTNYYDRFEHIQVVFFSTTVH